MSPGRRTWPCDLLLGGGCAVNSTEPERCEGRAYSRPAPRIPSVLRPADAGRDDVDGLATALGPEHDRTGDGSEERVVATTAHADAREELRAALADEDLTSVDYLAAVTIDA